MAVALHATHGAQAAATNTITVTLPADCQAGDFVYCMVASTDVNTVMTSTPAGWSLLKTEPNTDFTVWTFTWTVESGTDTYAPTFSIASNVGYAMAVLRGANLHSTGWHFNGYNWGYADSTTVTPTKDGLAVTMASLDSSTAGATVWSADVGTKRYEAPQPLKTAIWTQPATKDVALTTTCTHTVASQQDFTVATLVVSESLGEALSVWNSGLTSTGFTQTARLVGVPTVRLLVDGQQYTTRDVDADGYVRMVVSGLTPGVEHAWELQNALNDAPLGTGSLTTPVDAAFGYRIAFGNCHDSATEHVAYDAILARDPLMYANLGDWHYGDNASTSPGAHRQLIENKFVTNPSLKALVQQVPTVYIRSDHDGGGGNNADASAATDANITAYKQYAGYYPLADPNEPALYASWRIGRVRFIQIDGRNMYRSPAADPDGPGKTFLGAKQKAWLKEQLLQPEPVKVILADVAWHSSKTDDDKWGSYATERQEIADFITDNDVDVIYVYGDWHTVGFSTGTNNPYGGFPLVTCGPQYKDGGVDDPSALFDFVLNANPGYKTRYGLLDVADTGTAITVTVGAYDAVDDSLIYSKAFVYTSSWAPPTPKILKGMKVSSGDSWFTLLTQTELKNVVAASSDFTDFKSRIADMEQ